MYKLYSWAGKDDITTFCWSESDYKQLWDEIYIKARNHDEYRNFLKTFVDLQASLSHILKTKKSLSLDAAMKLCHLKFKGQRHTAFADAFNTARILNKAQSGNLSLDELPKLSTYIETNIAKRFDASIPKDKDYTTSLASFISPEILQQLRYKESTTAKKAEVQPDSQNKIIRLLSKKVYFIKYGIKFPTWVTFSVKMLLVKDMVVEEAKIV